MMETSNRGRDEKCKIYMVLQFNSAYTYVYGSDTYDIPSLPLIHIFLLWFTEYFLLRCYYKWNQAAMLLSSICISFVMVAFTVVSLLFLFFMAIDTTGGGLGDNSWNTNFEVIRFFVTVPGFIIPSLLLLYSEYKRRKSLNDVDFL